jgi:heat shock protein HslJ
VETMKKRALALLLVFIAVLVFACGPQPDTLQGSWLLESVTVDGQAYQLDPRLWERNAAGAPAWVRFDQDGWFEGRGPCNDFQGYYQFDGEVLIPADATQSAVGCGDRIDAAEQVIFSFLWDEGRVTFSGDRSQFMQWTDEKTALAFARTRQELSLP